MKNLEFISCMLEEGCDPKCTLSLAFDCYFTDYETAKKQVTEICEDFFRRENIRIPITIKTEDGRIVYTSEPDLK